MPQLYYQYFIFVVFIFVLPVYSDEVFFPVPLTIFWYKKCGGVKRRSMKGVKMAFIPMFSWV